MRDNAIDYYSLLIIIELKWQPSSIGSTLLMHLLCRIWESSDVVVYASSGGMQSRSTNCPLLFTPDAGLMHTIVVGNFFCWNLTNKSIVSKPTNSGISSLATIYRIEIGWFIASLVRQFYSGKQFWSAYLLGSRWNALENQTTADKYCRETFFYIIWNIFFAAVYNLISVWQLFYGKVFAILSLNECDANSFLSIR